jgi:hypothetical protein
VLSVSPRPQVSGVRELGRRWGISREAARLVVARPGFPKPTILDMGRVWDDADVDDWEAAERAAGRALPGEAGHGPPPGTRRGGPAADAPTDLRSD